MNKFGKIDYKNSNFTMISPNNRNIIINNINNILNYELNETNRTTNFWTNNITRKNLVQKECIC